MYWFVIYAARLRTRARVEAPLVGPPEVGSWLSCPPAAAGDRRVSRYTAILGAGTWEDLCGELGLDLERVCRHEGRGALCEVGPLPAVFVDQQPVELPGLTAAVLDMRECVVGPLAAIALELPDPPESRGAATRLEVGLCVAPLPESDAERETVRSLFSAIAFNIGDADVELRCPDCASPELRWLGGTAVEEQMRCANCGARLRREAAFLRLCDCEEILASVPPSPILAAALAAGVPSRCSAGPALQS